MWTPYTVPRTWRHHVLLEQGAFSSKVNRWKLPHFQELGGKPGSLFSVRQQTPSLRGAGTSGTAQLPELRGVSISSGCLRGDRCTLCVCVVSCAQKQSSEVSTASPEGPSSRSSLCHSGPDRREEPCSSWPCDCSEVCFGVEDVCPSPMYASVTRICTFEAGTGT